MAERATVTELTQIGVEATPGTPVAADKLLPSLSFAPQIKADVNAFRPAGNKYPTIHAMGREWLEASISGAATYTEIVYLFSGLLGGATVAPEGAGGAQKWTFSPSSTAPETPKTFTVEQGSSVRAGKWAYGLVSEVGLTISRQEIGLSGKMLGQAYTDGITLTATPTAVAQVPMLAKEFDVYIDTTAGGLGTTKLTRAFKAEVTLGDKYSPVWPVDSANASFAAHVDTPVAGKLKLTLEADAAGMARLGELRSGAFRYVRIVGTSAVMAGSGPETHKMTLDLAVQGAGEPSTFDDEDGVTVITWDADITHDASWGKALTASVVNAQAAL